MDELKVMRKILEILGTLEPSERIRVLAWINAKANEEIEAERNALGFGKRQSFDSQIAVVSADLVGTSCIGEQ